MLLGRLGEVKLKMEQLAKNSKQLQSIEYTVHVKAASGQPCIVTDDIWHLGFVPSYSGRLTNIHVL